MSINKSFTKRLKKIAAIILAALIVFLQGPSFYVLAQEAPSAPTAPTAPTAPEPPPPPPDAPEAPEAPTSPTEAESTSSTNDGNNDEESNWDEEEDEEGNSSNTSSTGTQEQGTSQTTGNSSGSNGTGGTSADNLLGDPSITTGDATNTAGINTSGNNNFSGASLGSNNGSGISIANDGNGSGSDNSGSVSIDSSDTTNQSNSAIVTNNLYQETETGDNSASRNVGTSTITTGDANTTGTLITAVNTNVDGVAVYEFNVADDQVGDIVLDFNSNCISGCLGGDSLVKNSDNGTDSTNNAEVNSTIDSYTFQNNDATVNNNMTLDADSGNNDADRNTGGDSTITTGDANVSANALTFANNNLSGAVIYSVVNIFGDLVGDIIFPEGFCCFSNVTAQNTGNGADSTNTAVVDLSNTDILYQFNEADIQNNVIVYANTGENVTSKNTGGNSTITTGEANVEAQVINVANTNISGGDWWLVIVNEAGNWIGKILGAPSGALFAGSSGFDIFENAAGEVFVTNSGNGAGSTNTATVNQEVNNTTVQTNTATVVNNLDLSANTGGNSASRNTGGNSSITTGDAEVIANLVNFVNNNIAGGGRLFVNVINVFGSWLGDFVGPGQKKESQAAATNSEAGVGGASQGGNSSASGSSNSGSGGNNNTGTQTLAVSSQNPIPTITFNVGSLVAGTIVQSSQLSDNSDAGPLLSLGADSTQTAGNVINVNLAWLIMLIPIYLGLTLLKRRKKLLKFLPLKYFNLKIS